MITLELTTPGISGAEKRWFEPVISGGGQVITVELRTRDTEVITQQSLPYYQTGRWQPVEQWIASGIVRSEFPAAPCGENFVYFQPSHE